MASVGFEKTAALTIAIASLMAAGCDSWPQIGGVPIDDLPNYLCESAETADAGTSMARTSPPHVVVHAIRGWGDISSIGLDAVTNELTADGVDASVHHLQDWQSVGDQLVLQHTAKSNAPGIVLIGHSYGSDDAVWLAIQLKQQNIPVRLLLLLDATDPPPIPDNVDRCVHYYVPWPGDPAPDTLPGQPVVPAAGNTHTVIVNDALGILGSHSDEWCLQHMGLDSSKYVQHRIMQEIFALTN